MKEVIILGTAPSRVDCPFGCETWGVNGVYTMEKYNIVEGKPFRLDKLFITDTTFSPEGNLHFDIREMHRIKKRYGTEFVTLNPIGFGNLKLISTPFPWKEITEKFKTYYFSSSVSYMLAYALYKNYEKVRIFGIDINSKQEYMMQKGGIEYWIGRFHERGCEVIIQDTSAIMKTSTGTPYGHKKEYDLSKIDPYNLLGRKDT